MTIRLLSAGAAKGLATRLEAQFIAVSGLGVDGQFSAVGAIRDRFLAGEACDVLILTARQMDELMAEGRLHSGSVAPIGTVHTAVAVLAGHAAPDISTGQGLAAAMRAAGAIYLPDPQRSTAGIHVLGVLRALGIEAEVAGRLRVFPNGEAAMAALAADAIPGSIGSTQTTEINNTPGLTLVGPLPPGHGLATVYSAGVNIAAAGPAAAFVALLTGPDTLPVRRACGFE